MDIWAARRFADGVQAPLSQLFLERMDRFEMGGRLSKPSGEPRLGWEMARSLNLNKGSGPHDFKISKRSSPSGGTQVLFCERNPICAIFFTPGQFRIVAIPAYAHK